MEGTMVYVTNRGTDKRTFMYANRNYVLEPNKKIPVPFEAAALWFGDPRSSETIAAIRDDNNNVQTWVPDRDSELRRLQVRYGGEDNARLPDDIVIETMEGDELYSAAQDPDGEHVTPIQTSVSEAQAKDAKIASLEERLARMEALLTGDSGKVEKPLTGEQEPEPDEVPPITNDSGAEGIPDADETPGNKPKGGRSIK